MKQSKAKSIVMITNDTTFAYNLRREILVQLLQKQYQVTLIGEILSFREEFEAIGCNLINVQTRRRNTSILQDLHLFIRYFQILYRSHPNMVLTNNIKPNVYAGIACRLLRIPYIPNITGLGTPLENPGPLQTLTTLLYRMGIAKASTILFQNTENLKFFKDRKIMPSKAKPVLLPGSGVNLENHPPMPYPLETQVHFLFVARIMQEKGINFYLAAAKRVREKWPNTVFHICGGCDDKKYVEILKHAQTERTVIYHGYQKDMVPFFEMAHCIVHPSYYPEGMSNVLLEAAACARPIITTNRSGCREAVNDGETGFIVPTKDEDALVSAIEKFMGLPWEQKRDMGLAGREKMEKEYDRKIVVQMHMDQIAQQIGQTELPYGL